MRRIDILYNNLLSLIKDITYEGENFESYHNSKDSIEKSRLVDLSEKLISERKEINRVKLNLQFYPDFNQLVEIVKEFGLEFHDYPSYRQNEILCIITIIEKLTIEYSSSDIELNEELDTNMFELFKVEDLINRSNFFYFDNTNIEESIVLFDLAHVDAFRNFILNISSGSELLFYLLSKIGNSSAILSVDKYIFVKTSFSSKKKQVLATLSLHIIRSGECIHESYEYTAAPSITANSVVTLGSNYHQFNDSLNILSEYNFQKDILDKYLRLYHLYENFMYKSQLVLLENKSSGEVFSIRDFKRMYDRISDSEINMLKKLFENILPLDYSSSIKFEDQFLSEWMQIVTNYFSGSDVKINELLKNLNVKNTKGEIYKFSDINDTSKFKKFFPNLVYAYRNTMVHNRETEFHLTHTNLSNHPIMDDTARIVLENFLIPNLEKLVLYLICCENDFVWFSDDKLILWKND